MGISKDLCGIMNAQLFFSPHHHKRATGGSQLAVSWDILSTQGFACSRLVDANYHTGLIVVSGVYYASLLAVLLNIVIVDDTKVDVDG